jgi:hypothetical protein
VTSTEQRSSNETGVTEQPNHPSLEQRYGVRRIEVHLATGAGVFAILAILLIGVGGAGACNPPSPGGYQTLATIPLIDAIAANTSTVFVAGVQNCSNVYAINPAGGISLYANVSVPATDICSEGALALAPLPCQNDSGGSGWGQTYGIVQWGGGGGGGGQGGCGHCHNQSPGDVLYYAVDGRVYEITDGGTNVTTIATFSVPNKTSENMGLAYDSVGGFNHDLIVTSSSKGMVWLLNASNGSSSVLAELHTYIGGPSVAPWWFGNYGGDVLIAEKTLGQILAIAPNGTETVVTNWSDANAVALPPNGGGCGGGGCAFGPNHDVLFLANYSSGGLEAFSIHDLQGLGGQGFIAGGLNMGVASFTSSGATTLFLGNTERLSDITFISCFPGQNGGGGGHGGW